jgi:Zn-dependent peptidase ImmA (M78 family)
VGKKELIQLAVQNFMKKIGPNYPVNLQQVARQVNTYVYNRSDMPHNVNGATIALKDGSYIIAIKSRQPIFNERFAIAQEIAHIVLGHCTGGIIITSPSEMYDQGIFPCDWESYAFALEMLVPLEELKHTLDAHEVLDIDKLCTLYGVSGEIIKTRLKEIDATQFNPTLPYTLSLVCC